MIERYQTKAINDIFSDINKYKTWAKVEMAYLSSYVEYHNIAYDESINALKIGIKNLDWPKFINNTKKHEEVTRHDVIAFLQSLEDEFKDHTRLIHMGLTSSDIVDTALALLLKEAIDQIITQLTLLLKTLWRKAHQYKGVLCLGRTHGQAAESMSLGIKLLSHIAEISRSLTRINLAKEECLVGKFAGAVGVYAFNHPDIEKLALANLGLQEETIATQIVARDRYASLFMAMAILASSIERLGVELRLLMHGNIKELSEPFFTQQKGSSAMPHKKNPILCENICGLMRMVRSYILPALENQILWHERDISHSSVERIIIPDMFHLLDFALNRLILIIDNLVVNEEMMKKNLQEVSREISSQLMLSTLIKEGLGRQEAYEKVQHAVHNNSWPDINNEEIFKLSHETLLFNRVESILKNLLII